MPLRIVYFGTADLACAGLEALARSLAFQVAAVVTQPDKPRGRDLQLQPTPVKSTALRFGLPVLQPKRARDEAFLAELRDLRPELVVVTAYGQILPQALLDIPRHGCLNVHTSLLPRHRGAAPIQWAILSGDAETGVTIMKMDAGLDTGPILTQARTNIAPDETSLSLHDRLARMGAELLVTTIPRYLAGEIIPIPQPEGATYARKIEKSDGLIDWMDDAALVERKIRAFTPWPGTHTFLKSPEGYRMIKVLQGSIRDNSGQPGMLLAADRHGLLVACGKGSLLVTKLQPEGRKRMTAQEFLAGHSLPPGTAFSR